MRNENKKMAAYAIRKAEKMEAARLEKAANMGIKIVATATAPTAMEMAFRKAISK